MKRVTITFKTEEVSAKGFSILEKELEAEGAFVLRSHEEINSCVCDVSEECIKKLRKRSDIIEVYEHLDNEVHVLETLPLKGDYAGKEVNYGVYLAGCIDLQGNDVGWKVSLGKGVKVFVLDTGGDVSHKDIAWRKELCYNVFTDFAGAVPPDGHGHGTHVAGIIAAHGSTRFRGLAPACSIGAVKVLADNGYGTWADITEGLLFVLKNHDKGIVNMSLGSSREPPISMKNAIDQLVEKGFIVVAAAGNDGGMTGFPARWERVLSVSAIDKEKNIAQWSSRGKVEFAGAGVSIWSTDKGNSYSFKSGTSMATPYVSGVLALIWAENLEMKANEVLKVAIERAEDIGDSGKDTLYGFGLARFVEIGKEPKPIEPEPKVRKVLLDNVMLLVDEVKGDTAVVRKERG